MSIHVKGSFRALYGTQPMWEVETQVEKLRKAPKMGHIDKLEKGEVAVSELTDDSFGIPNQGESELHIPVPKQGQSQPESLTDDVIGPLPKKPRDDVSPHDVTT